MSDRKCGRKLRLLAWLILVVGTGIFAIVLVNASLLPRWGGWLLFGLGLGVGHFWMYKPGGVPAVIYHSVSDSPEWLPWHREISVKPETFELHLRLIKKMGCTVLSSEQFIQHRKTGTLVPPRSVMIHLDDGYVDNWVAAFPLLKKYGMSATLFVSTDFIEEGELIRPQLPVEKHNKTSGISLQWEGYVNWRELEVMEKSGVISVQAHGTDHGRGEVDNHEAEILNEDNWRKLIWKQWHAMPGSKHRWHQLDSPPHFPLGATVGNSIPALSGPVLSRENRLESQDEYETRVREVFRACRDVIGRRLDKEVAVFCWPHNVFSEVAHAIAIESGFVATTAGSGENRLGEDYRRISRVHVHENVLGWYWPRAEALAFRANVRLFQGNYYWYPVVIALNTTRKLVRTVNKSTGK